MRTNKNLRRVVAASAVTAVTAGLVATATAPANAFTPAGADAEVILEHGSIGVTGDPANAIEDGTWADGGTGITLSLNAGTGGENIDDVFAALGIDDPSKLTYAFLPASVDPTTITATEGEPIGQIVEGVGGWWTAAGFGSTWEAPNFVGEVSTQAQWAAYLAAGKPPQLYNAAGINTSTAPEGSSVLNTWPAGTNLRLLAIATDGTTVSALDPTYALQSKVDPDATGHLQYAELDFTTVAVGGQSSGGFHVTSFGVPADPKDDTTTTLSVAPASPVTAGTSVTLTATVTDSAIHGDDDGTPAGSVEFFDGSVSLGTDSTAPYELTTSSLSVASHSLTAVFTPSSNHNGSTSSVSTLVVNGNPTTIAGGATPGADAGVAVDLDADVTPLGVAGTVHFKENGSDVEAVAVDPVTGHAHASHVFGPGGHTITAVFEPSVAGYGGSQVVFPAFNLDPAAGVSVDEQNITGEIPAGALVITTPYFDGDPAHDPNPDDDIHGPLDLGVLALTSDLSRYTASATFEDIFVHDTRAGEHTWVATAYASALTSGTNSINPQNLGLTDLTLDAHIGLHATTSTENPAGTNGSGLPFEPADAGSAGLADPGTSLHAGAAVPQPGHVVLEGQGASSDTWHGTLTLNAPVDTPAGVYTGTITFTAA